jgi:hypothetical protein
VVCEPEPLVLGYDENAWAVALDYHGQPLEPALATVRAVRAHTTAVIRRLPEAAWAREGRHTASGRYTAEDWLRIYAEHLENHARQSRPTWPRGTGPAALADRPDDRVPGAEVLLQEDDALAAAFEVVEAAAPDVEAEARAAAFERDLPVPGHRIP